VSKGALAVQDSPHADREDYDLGQCKSPRFA